MDNKEIEKLIEEKFKRLVPDYLESKAFTQRKLSDTPTDNLQVVPRKYVNMNGSIASAPIGSIIGQQYFASDLGYPVFKNANSRWANSVGSVVG